MTQKTCSLLCKNNSIYVLHYFSLIYEALSYEIEALNILNELYCYKRLQLYERISKVPSILMGCRVITDYLL